MQNFSTNLQKARFEKRYKRFFVDAVLEDGTRVTAHCPNTGSMKSCLIPGATIWLSFNDSPNRKLKWTWELIETDGGFIGVNTAMPNRIVEQAIKSNLIPELSGYLDVKAEVKYGTKSRIDLLLTSPQKPECYIEIKNTTLLDGSHVLFPDAVTERGQKHLKDLEGVVRSGKRAVIFFLVNRPEGRAFKPADHIDPVYGELLRQVCKNGVEALAYRAVHTTKGIGVGERVPIILNT